MSLAQRMLAAFEGSKVAHGTTTVGKLNRSGKAEADSRIVREPLTEQIMQGHIDGKQGIGAIPINDENNCRWGALDIDIYDLDHNKLQANIRKLELPLLHCRSKSGGAHLYLFLDDYEPANVVREYLSEMAVSLGHSGCEIFPKQDKILADRGDVGNFINLPYFNAELPQRYCFNAAVEAVELDEFVDMIESSKTPLSALEKLRTKKQRTQFGDGPPCLQHLFRDGPNSDDRNKKLFMCGVYCRMKHPDDWVKQFETMNHQLFTTPLDAKEVLGLQKSLDKKEYFYTCEQEPFKSYCVHVVSVLVADRKVSFPVPRCYGYAYNVSVLAHPSWTKGRQVRVACLKVNGDLLVMRQVRKIDRDIPCQFLGLIHLGSNDTVLLK
jgi:hypothetical protein